jgi:hypothetical protein
VRRGTRSIRECSRIADSGSVVSIEDPDGEQGFFGTGDTPQDAMVDLLGKLPTSLESA